LILIQRACAGLLLFFVAFGAITSTQAATDIEGEHPAIGIIIDDLGNRLARGARAVILPGAVACAFLPQTPHAYRLARFAHSLNKEVILHLPMESQGLRDPGPGTLTLDMTERELIRTLEENLASVPYVVGVNNHMGSLLTSDSGHMQWLMRQLRQRGNLFFVDSRTIDTTVARKVAIASGVPSLQRDIFLDNERDPQLILRQFEMLLNKARLHGSAIGIGHPYPETMAVLERELPKLEEKGIRLLPLSELIHLQPSRQSLPPAKFAAPSRGTAHFGESG